MLAFVGGITMPRYAADTDPSSNLHASPEARQIPQVEEYTNWVAREWLRILDWGSLLPAGETAPCLVYSGNRINSTHPTSTTRVARRALATTYRRRHDRVR
jgi:hypothetical protein